MNVGLGLKAEGVERDEDNVGIGVFASKEKGEQIYDFSGPAYLFRRWTAALPPRDKTDVGDDDVGMF